MDRKIKWGSGCFDEIQHVYEKAESNPAAAEVLRSLEESALQEGSRYAAMFQFGGKVLSPEIFPKLPNGIKERIIHDLGEKGLTECKALLTEHVINVTLSDSFSDHPACTILYVLDVFEKLEKQYKIWFPLAELRLQMPVGSSKDAVRLRMMSALLYPWIKTTGTVTDQLSGKLAAKLQINSPSFDAAAAAKERKEPVTDDELLQCFKKYFAPNTKFYSVEDSPEYKAYFGAINAATQEMADNPGLFRGATGLTIKDLKDTLDNWKPGFTSMKVCGMIFLTGEYAVIPDRLLCVDFSESIPNCIALYLLLTAQLQPRDKRIQTLDLGNAADPGPLKKAINGLKLLDRNWQCIIAFP